MKTDNWTTTIKIHQLTKIKLAKHGKFGDTYEDIIKKLIKFEN